MFFIRLLIGACNPLCNIAHGRLEMLVQSCTDTRRVGAILHTLSDPRVHGGLVQYCIMQYCNTVLILFFPPLVTLAVEVHKLCVDHVHGTSHDPEDDDVFFSLIRYSHDYC